jgi:PadR family transcriptional regulator, regulatory protein PadR
MQTINYQNLDRELKKGRAELLILSLQEVRPRQGYEVRKLIEKRSDGVFEIQCRLTAGSMAGGWKTGQRRRRYYKLTREGKQCWRLSAASGSHLSRRSTA